VLKAALTNSTKQGFWDFGTAGDHKAHYPNSSGEIEDNFGTATRLYKTPATNGLNNYHLYQVISKTNDWRCYINTNLLFAPGLNNAPAFPTTPTIGRSPATSGFNYFSGNIAEVLIFSPPLTNSATNTVREYLRAKYNLW
jgi:hypothetical protein